MIRFFDMFSGIGGFRAGLERAGNTLGLRLKAAHEASGGRDRGGTGGGGMIPRMPF